MIDPKIIRDEPDRIRRMLKARAVDFDLDGLLEAFEERKDLNRSADDLRRRRNEIGVLISRRKKAGEDVSDLLREMGSLSTRLSAIEESEKETGRRYADLARSMPNMIHESVPVGPDDGSNREMRRWGAPPSFDCNPKDHVEISVNRGLVDMERAAKVSGSRFYYMKGDLVRLNQALMNYALDLLRERGYTAVQPPYMINRRAMEGAVIAEDFEDVIYKVQDDDLYLIGTSEHAMAAMHADEILDGKRLPMRYAGISPCFRKEAGAHGRDQKGIFRVHQFEKIEQFVFSRPEESWKEHERMLAVAEEFYRNLEIPYRVVLLSSGDMGKVSAKTYDIEGWMAGQQAYREIVSCSNCADFQSRRLMIRFRDSTDAQTSYVHTLNSTLVATSRVLVGIIENFQTAGGRIKVPGVLQKYVGLDEI